MELFVLDQLLKGRMPEGSKILDAGSAEGRNLLYFLAHNYDLHAIDQYQMAINMLNMIAKSAAKQHSDGATLTAQVADVREIPYADNSFDVVMCISVLHFMKNEADAKMAFGELIRVLKKGGILLLQTATEGSDEVSFLLDPVLLGELIDRHNLKKEEPIKKVDIENRNSLLSVVLKKE